jgi:phosphoglycolate phosphatase-like HAD superfamily hydrolase
VAVIVSGELRSVGRTTREGAFEAARTEVGAVLFDLDGTLVDLRQVYLTCHRLAAAEVLGIELADDRVLELMATGAPIRTHMAAISVEHAERLVECFVGHYRVQRAALARPFPGLVDLLRTLKEAGIAVAVVTSKLRADALAELASTALAEHVATVVAFEDVTEHKPSPAPQLEALRRLHCGPGIGVGDLPTDVASARAAGLPALAVTWGYGDRRALADAGAERVCATPDELREAITALLGV